MFRLHGLRVLLVDLDPQGNASTALDAPHHAGVPSMYDVLIDGRSIAEVTVPKWFFVYNHLHTVHAIASCNAAEIAMGMLMEATVPTSHRWIPKAMNVQYLAEATGLSRVVGLCHSVYWTMRGLADLVDVPYEEIVYRAAGVNHQAWILRFEHEGGFG